MPTICRGTRAITTALTAVFALTLGGCGLIGVADVTSSATTPTEEHITLTGEENAVDDCPWALVPVEQIETVTPVRCSLAGSTVVFSDGVELDIEHGTGASEREAPGGLVESHAYVELGIYGTVLTHCDPAAGTRSWWGSPEGLDIVRQAGWWSSCPEQ
jgi:hypothetical protein